LSRWLSAAAASGTRLTRTLGLDRRARNRAKGTEHATVAWFRLEYRAAAGACIEILAGIGRHHLRSCGGAMRAGDNGFTNHRSSRKHVANVGGSGRIGKHRGFEIICSEVMTNGEAEYVDHLVGVWPDQMRASIPTVPDVACCGTGRIRSTRCASPCRRRGPPHAPADH
jgi:hypothetical protein